MYCTKLFLASNISHFQSKSILQNELDSVNSLASASCQLRQLALGAIATSPVDAPPTDPDVWPPPTPLPRKSTLSARSKTVVRKPASSQSADNKAKKSVMRKSASQSGIEHGASSKRASSVGRVAKVELHEESIPDEKESDVCDSFLSALLTLHKSPTASVWILNNWLIVSALAACKGKQLITCLWNFDFGRCIYVFH